MYAALLTWFIRRHDDGPVGTETCSLPFIKYKYDVPDVNCFIILAIHFSLLCRWDILQFLTFPNYFYDFVTHFVHITLMHIILLGFPLCRRVMHYSLWYLYPPHKNNIISCWPLSNTNDVKELFSLRLIKHLALKTYGVAVHLRAFSGCVLDWRQWNVTRWKPK
jgi:hypothetical protein